MKKFVKFLDERGRGMPPGEFYLVVYIGWLEAEREVKASSFRQYLSTIRKLCEHEGI